MNQGQPRGDQPTNHTLCCASVTTNIRFRSWIRSLPSTLQTCGVSPFATNKIHTKLLEISHSENRLDCGYKIIYLRANIDQNNEKVSLYAKLVGSNNHLILIIGVPEPFQLRNNTPNVLHPMEYELYPLSLLKPGVLETVEKKATWEEPDIMASCFFFTIPSHTPGQVLSKLHYVQKHEAKYTSTYRLQAVALQNNSCSVQTGGRLGEINKSTSQQQNPNKYPRHSAQISPN